ncbi:MAG: hypothetical protein IH614_06210 [Desulfuromonadales bacterium]|nr:hypothetical protein [Desulfuromonadales bacterium]
MITVVRAIANEVQPAALLRRKISENNNGEGFHAERSARSFLAYFF